MRETPLGNCVYGVQWLLNLSTRPSPWSSKRKGRAVSQPRGLEALLGSGTIRRRANLTMQPSTNRGGERRNDQPRLV